MVAGSCGVCALEGACRVVRLSRLRVAHVSAVDDLWSYRTVLWVIQVYLKSNSTAQNDII